MSFGRKVTRRTHRLERKLEAVGGMRVKCKSHGKRPWLGDIVCGRCGKIHLIDDDTKIHSTIDENGQCSCGAQLFPVRDEAGEIMKDVPFFAKVACRDCARAEYAKQQAGAS